MTEPTDSLAVDYAEAAMSVVPVVGPLLAPLGKRLASAVVQEQRRRNSVALRAAERLSGLSREDLEEQIASDPRLVSLATRLLYSAGMVGADSSLLAMGGALGHATAEPDKSGDAEVLIAVVEGLREGHYATLKVIASEPPEVPGETREWTAHLLREAPGSRSEYADTYLAALTSTGLVTSQSGLDYGTFHVSALGHALLEVVAEAVEEASD